MKAKAPIIIVVFSILIGLLAVGVSFLPKIVVVKTQYQLKPDREVVIRELSAAQVWKNSLILQYDSAAKFIDITAKNGGKPGFKWFSKKLGDGAFQIKNITADSLTYEMISDNNQFREKGVFYFLESGSVCEIKWMDTLDISTSLISRISAKNEKFIKRLEKQNQVILSSLEQNISQTK